MSATYVSRELRQRVANIAQHQCEYCHAQELVPGMPFEIEDIIPEVAGGPTEEANLCLACPRCNRHKGNQTFAVDDESGASVPLFHPREQIWNEHFTWEDDGLFIRGLSAVGRVTVIALRLNNPFAVRARYIWIASGWHPPRL